MTAYAFSVTSGDWNVSTNWTPNGVPRASDTVSFSGAARKVIVPTGYTAQVLGMTFSGSNTSNRGEVEINGTLELYGDVTQSTWTTLNINGGILDVRSYYWFVSQADGTGKRAEVLGSNGGKIISSTTIGGFTGPSGATGDPGTGALSLEDFHIENVHFRYGSAWYPGNKFVIDNVSFYNCGIVQHEPYIDDAADWIVRAVTFVGTQASGDYKCYLSCRDKGGTITGQRIFENVVWDYSAASGTRLIRLRWFPAVMSPAGLYVYRAFIEGGLFYPTVSKMFSCPSTTVVGEAIAGVTNSYFFIDRDNPHTLQGMCENVSESVIEATYGAGYTDAADHFVLATSGTFVIEYNLIIDGVGGVCMNALNSTFNGSYTFRHNTYVADVEDAVYGQFCRTENFGEFSTGGTLNIHSNISYARSNPSGAANIRVLNIEEPGDDQVDLMDNNCVYGMGSTLTTLFSGVTSASKGSYGSQAGWGLNDLIGTDPQFVDDTRGLMSWGATLSLSDQDDVIKELIYGVNGYDGSTHTQTGTTTLDLDDLLDHVRAGFAPTNSALENAGYDSITIGALEYADLETTIDSLPSNLRISEPRTIIISVSETVPTTENITLKINADVNAGISPTSVTSVIDNTYEIEFVVPDTYAGLKYNITGYPIILDTVDGQVISGNVPYLPVTGNSFVDAESVPGDLTVLSGDLVIGAQAEYETLGVVDIGGDDYPIIELDEDLNIIFSGDDPAGVSFNVRMWDPSDETWGSYALQTLNDDPVGEGNVIYIRTNKITTQKITSQRISCRSL